MRLINQDRNAFAATMVALGHADGVVTGVTRSFDVSLEEVMRAIDPSPAGRVIVSIRVYDRANNFVVRHVTLP